MHQATRGVPRWWSTMPRMALPFQSFHPWRYFHPWRCQRPAESRVLHGLAVLRSQQREIELRGEHRICRMSGTVFSFQILRCSAWQAQHMFAPCQHFRSHAGDCWSTGACSAWCCGYRAWLRQAMASLVQVSKERSDKFLLGGSSSSFCRLAAAFWMAPWPWPVAIESSNAQWSLCLANLRNDVMGRSDADIHRKASSWYVSTLVFYLGTRYTLDWFGLRMAS